MSTTISPTTPLATASARPWRWGGLTALARAFAPEREDEAIQRTRERLADHDDRLLQDAGLTYEQAHGHARRPDWAAPDWWKMRTF